MARKKKHEEHENLERWLVSYADFITLLFAFFVVMYSVSSVNEGKYRVLSESIVSAFNAQSKAPAPVQFGKPPKSSVVVPRPDRLPAPPDSRRGANEAGPRQGQMMPPVQLPLPAVQSPAQSERERREAQAIKEMSNEIERELGELIQRDLVSVRRSRLWLEVEIKTSILFSSGSSRLSASAMATLGRIATVLKRYPNPIHVEGFTDNVPIKSSVFPSNWELSAARAASVVHLFSGAGVEPERLAATGFGEFRPVSDNNTAEGRMKNRRIVLVVMSDSAQRRTLDTPPASTSATPLGDLVPQPGSGGWVAPESAAAAAPQAEQRP